MSPSNSLKKTWFIYELVESDTGIVRYVGCTSNPWNRLASHIRRPGSVALKRWIWTLKQRLANVELRIVRQHPSESEARRLEASHIRAMAALVGPNLLNMACRPRRFMSRLPLGPEHSGTALAIARNEVTR